MGDWWDVRREASVTFGLVAIFGVSLVLLMTLTVLDLDSASMLESLRGGPLFWSISIILVIAIYCVIMTRRMDRQNRKIMIGIARIVTFLIFILYAIIFGTLGFLLFAFTLIDVAGPTIGSTVSAILFFLIAYLSFRYHDQIMERVTH